MQGPTPIFLDDLQGPSKALNLEHPSWVPEYSEHTLGYSAHPDPVVTHLGNVSIAVRGINLSHSAFVFAVLLWLHNFLMQTIESVAESKFQHNSVPFLPLNFAQSNWVPLYSLQGAMASIHPLPFVTHPGRLKAQLVSVVDDLSSRRLFSMQGVSAVAPELFQHLLPLPVKAAQVD